MIDKWVQVTGTDKDYPEQNGRQTENEAQSDKNEDTAQYNEVTLIRTMLMLLQRLDLASTDEMNNVIIHGSDCCHWPTIDESCSKT